MSATSTTSFPPRQLADFVVHYDDTAFHVHKLVLHHHSAYFRTYFATLLPLPRGGSAPSKRRRLKRNSSPNPAFADVERCDHPHIAHCIYLPQQTTLVGKQAVTAAHFELFLRHLYFSDHYCYPPYLPQTDVDLDTDPAPLSLIFPTVSSLDWTTKSPQLRFTDACKLLVSSESLLSLAHYFDCAAMMAQCEAVMLTQLEWEKAHKAWLEGQSWHWLPYCDRYHLERAKKAYIGVIAAVSGLGQSAEFKSAKLTWDKTLVMQLMEAALECRK